MFINKCIFIGNTELDEMRGSVVSFTNQRSSINSLKLPCCLLDGCLLPSMQFFPPCTETRFTRINPRGDTSWVRTRGKNSRWQVPSAQRWREWVWASSQPLRLQSARWRAAQQPSDVQSMTEVQRSEPPNSRIGVLWPQQNGEENLQKTKTFPGRVIRTSVNHQTTWFGTRSELFFTQRLSDGFLQVWADRLDGGDILHCCSTAWRKEKGLILFFKEA